jgi:chromosome partitioning protein
MVNAQLDRETLFAYETDSSTAEEARQQYRRNTAELIRRLTTPNWRASKMNELGINPDGYEAKL